MEKDYAVGLFDGTVRVYDSKHNLVHNELLHKDTVTDVGFCYVDKKCYLTTCSSDQTVHLYDYTTTKSLDLAFIGNWYPSWLIVYIGSTLLRAWRPIFSARE